MTMIESFALIALLGALIFWVVIYNRRMRRERALRALTGDFIQCVEGLIKHSLPLDVKSEMICLRKAANEENWWDAAGSMSTLSPPYWREENNNGIQEEWLELSELFFKIKEYVK